MFPFASSRRLCKQPVLKLLQRRLINGCVSEKVVVDGSAVHVDRVGHGPHALLLLPGALGSSRTDFGPQLEHLDREKFTVYAWDPPGYGLSIPPERSWPKDFLRRDADAAAKVIRTLVPGPRGAVSLLGWSDGGITALIIASAHPELVRKLVVWGANAYVTRRDVELYEKLRDVRSWSDRMREPYESLYGASYFERHWHGWIDAMTRYHEAGGDIVKSSLHLVECPTLIVHGAEDPLVPAEHPDFLRAHIRHSRLVAVPRGKHNLHLRFSGAFNELVTEFLLR